MLFPAFPVVPVFPLFSQTIAGSSSAQFPKNLEKLEKLETSSLFIVADLKAGNLKPFPSGRCESWKRLMFPAFPVFSETWLIIAWHISEKAGKAGQAGNLKPFLKCSPEKWKKCNVAPVLIETN